MAAATSVGALTSSLSRFSISCNGDSPSMAKSLTIQPSVHLPPPRYLKMLPLSVVTAEDPSCVDYSVNKNLTRYVKSRLIGGFAAQKYFGTGRRKCAVARVVLLEGTGKVIINNRDAKKYLQSHPLWLRFVKAPLDVFGYQNKYDVFVKAQGGGLSGQAQAICLGVARALVRVSADHKPVLTKEKFLIRDPRRVERKKIGLKKARKAPRSPKR